LSGPAGNSFLAGIAELPRSDTNPYPFLMRPPMERRIARLRLFLSSKDLVMKISYYPGCALHGTALEFDESARAVSRALGVELCELPDWNCCVASSAHAMDDAIARDLVTRNLTIAEKQGLDLVIPCAACYGRFKAGAGEAHDGKTGPKWSFQVQSLLEFMASPALLEKIKTLRERPLAGLKVVCYYGCLLVRPPRSTGAKNHENPEDMDRLMDLLGAEVRPWSYKTDCCGGSLVLTRPDIVRQLVQKLFDRALAAGAEAIVVACPLCQSNLDSRQEEISLATGRRYDLPVLYFTELLGLAMKDRDTARWLKRHFVSPLGLLHSKELI
jgi:heterodisulfide reductase subunit B2